MAPRKETVQAKTSLLAILLADTFNQVLSFLLLLMTEAVDLWLQNFHPVSLECPTILLPLVNVPLVEYSLEWLAANEVGEVVVFCSSHVDQITKHFESSKWSPDSEFMKVRLITGKSAASVGDALRFVDQLHIVKNDFLILTGDTVTNVCLKSAYGAHQERRKVDSNSIMTMITAPANGDLSTVFVLDKETKRLLHYKTLSRKKNDASSIVCEASLFSERDTVQVRQDLFNSQIYICAPEVLMLFSDNFDYQTLEEDFISGVLSEEELGNKIFVHEAKREFAQRVQNMRHYHTVSRDVMARWSYPFVIDTRIFSSVSSKPYTFERGNRYCSSDVRLPLNVELTGTGICIGSGSIIGENCKIEESVIGQFNQIANGVQIKGSYLLDNVSIGPDVKIFNSLICDNVVIHSHAVISNGCVLSFGAIISSYHTVPDHTLVTLCMPAALETHEEIDSEARSPSTPTHLKDLLPTEATLEFMKTTREGTLSQNGERPAYFQDVIVGSKGAGCQWPHPDQKNFRFFSIDKPPSWSEWEESEIDESEAESAESGMGEGPDPDQLFEKEVVETFLRCVYQKFSKVCMMFFVDYFLVVFQENVILELNGLKLAELRSFVDCAKYIFTTLLQMCMTPPEHITPIYKSLFATKNLDLSQKSDQKAYLNSLTQFLEEWGSVLQRFLKDEDDQVELLFTFEEFFKGEGVFFVSSAWTRLLGPLISHICQLLYDKDVITEDAFLSWSQEKDQATDEEDKIFYSKAKPFLDWLEEAEESDSSD